MVPRAWFCRLVIAFGLTAFFFGTAATSQAEEWGRYYHWPYSDFHQYQWTPYEYEKVYDGGYRYPRQMRTFPTEPGNRNWLTVRKPFYRGNHFILDRF